VKISKAPPGRFELLFGRCYALIKVSERSQLFFDGEAPSDQLPMLAEL
jgi:hypothetical protein